MIKKVENINDKSDYKNAFSLTSKIDFEPKDIIGIDYNELLFESISERIDYNELLFEGISKSVSDNLKYRQILEAVFLYQNYELQLFFELFPKLL